MEGIRLRVLNLSSQESRSIIEFLTKNGNINNYKRKSNNELLRAIKKKAKITNNKKLSLKIRK